MAEYKNIGPHAEELSGGRFVGTGELVQLSAEDLKDPFNKRLIDEGILIEGIVEKEPTSKKGGESK